MKFTVEYKSVEAVTVEARDEDDAIHKAQATHQKKFRVVENSWDAYEEMDEDVEVCT